MPSVTIKVVRTTTAQATKSQVVTQAILDQSLDWNQIRMNHLPQEMKLLLHIHLRQTQCFPNQLRVARVGQKLIKHRQVILKIQTQVSSPQSFLNATKKR